MVENDEAVAEADTVILVVKPQDMAELLAEIRRSLKPDTLVVSLAAGVDTASIEARLPDGVAGGPGDAQHPGPGGRGHGGHLRRARTATTSTWTG